jgi:hypothetical protein
LRSSVHRLRMGTIECRKKRPTWSVRWALPQTVPFGMLLRKSLNINMLSGRHERLPVKSLVAQYGKLTYTVGKD